MNWHRTTGNMPGYSISRVAEYSVPTNDSVLPGT